MAIAQTLKFLISLEAQDAIRGFEKLGASAERDLDKTESKLDKLGSQFTKFGAAGLASAGVVGGALLGFAKQADEAAQFQIKLDNAIANSSVVSAEAGAKFKELATSLQQVTAADGDAILGAQALLVNFGLTEEQIIQLTPLVVDLARATGTDLNSAALSVAKSIDGSAKALKGYGIDIDETAMRTDAFAATVDALQGTVGGFAAREGETFAGQLESFRNSMGDLAEAIGSGVLPVITPLVNGMGNLASRFAVANEATAGFVGKIATIGTGALAAVSGLSLVAGQAIKMRDRFVSADGTLNTFGKTAGAVSLALAGLAVALSAQEVINTVAGYARNATQRLQELQITIGGLATVGGNSSAQIVTQFADLAASIGAKADIISAVMGQRLGREFQFTANGIEVDIEHMDEAFSQLASTSTTQAQAVIQALEAQAAAAPVGSRAYKDLMDAANRYRKELELLVGAQNAVSGAEVGVTKTTRGGSEEMRQKTRVVVTQSYRLSGLAEHYKKLEEAQKRAAGTTSSTAKTLKEKMEDFGNSLQKSADAQFNLTRAQRDSERSAKSLSDAQNDLTRAQAKFALVTGGYPRTSREAVDAMRRTEDAAKRLRDATLAQSDAARRVTQAEKALAALRTSIADSENVAKAERSLERAKYDVEEAAFKVKEAEEALAEVRKDPASSPTKIRRAEIALAESKFAVVEAVNDQKQAEQALADVRKQMESSDELAEAERELERAKIALSDSIDNVRDATLEQNNAQKEEDQILNGATKGTEQYKTALEELEDAKDRVRDATYANEDALYREAAAIRAVNDALAAQAAARGLLTTKQAQTVIENNTAAGLLNDKVGLTKSDSSGIQYARDIVINTGIGTNGVEAGRQIAEVLQQYLFLNPNGSAPDFYRQAQVGVLR